MFGFICSSAVYLKAFGIIVYVASDDDMINDLEKIWKEAVAVWLKALSRHLSGQLRNAMKIISQANRLRVEISPGISRILSMVLSSRPRRSVSLVAMATQQ